jgi:hypothetical protein
MNDSPKDARPRWEGEPPDPTFGLDTEVKNLRLIARSLLDRCQPHMPVEDWNRASFALGISIGLLSRYVGDAGEKRHD